MFVSRAPLLQALIGLFELPEDDSIPDDEHFIDIEDTPGYQTAFSQLAFAGKKEHDPIGEAVGNPKILLAQSLHKLSTACPGRVSQAPRRIYQTQKQPAVISAWSKMAGWFLAGTTLQVNLSSPSQVPSMLSTSLNAEGLQFLQGYFQVANVQLA